MTIDEIPFYKDISPRWEYQIKLSGVVYQLYFSWNERDSAFYMSILDQTGVLILGGIKLVPLYALTQQFRYLPGLPPGEFFLVDIEVNPATAQVTFENFGSRFVLYYVVLAEGEVF